MRNRRPRLLPSAERYVSRPAPPEPYIDPNAIERAALYLGVSELLDAAPTRRTLAIRPAPAAKKTTP